MVNKKNKKAQAFSADILVVIIIVLFGALFLVMNKINEEKNQDIEERANQAVQESKIIVDELKATGIIDSENRISANELLTLNKDEIKSRLNIKNDFAIVFEKNGNLVKIDSQQDINCVGSSSITVNGQTCQ